MKWPFINSGSLVFDNTNGLFHLARITILSGYFYASLRTCMKNDFSICVLGWEEEEEEEA